MNYLGVTYDLKHRPALDPDFIPFGIWMNEYEKGATAPIAIAVERNDGFISVRHAKIHNTPEMAAADYRFVERYMKFLLWSIGGFRVYVCGCGSITKKLQQAYSPKGERAFDCDFFQKLYERPLEILDLPLEEGCLFHTGQGTPQVSQPDAAARRTNAVRFSCAGSGVASGSALPPPAAS